MQEHDEIESQAGDGREHTVGRGGGEWCGAGSEPRENILLEV